MTVIIRLAITHISKHIVKIHDTILLDVEKRGLHAISVMLNVTNIPILKDIKMWYTEIRKDHHVEQPRKKT